jgi:hypothetical protein
LPFPAAAPFAGVFVDFNVDADDDAEGLFDVLDFEVPGIRYGVVVVDADDDGEKEAEFLELTYGPVAVNLVASAAERDIMRTGVSGGN